LCDAIFEHVVQRTFGSIWNKADFPLVALCLAGGSWKLALCLAGGSWKLETKVALCLARGSWKLEKQRRPFAWLEVA